MRSGSQTELVFEEIPFISDDDFGFNLALEMSTSDSNAGRSENLSWSEETTLAAPTQIKLKSARLLHGRSPLGLATPILADDLKISVARPARILHIICEERRGAQPLTMLARRADACDAEWKTLKAAVPRIEPTTATPTIVRSRSLHRKRNVEPPLARCLVKDFQLKFYRRRVVELALGKGLARRFNLKIQTRNL